MKYKNETCSMLNGFKVTERVLDLTEEETQEYAKEIKKVILEYANLQERKIICSIIKK